MPLIVKIEDQIICYELYEVKTKVEVKELDEDSYKNEDDYGMITFLTDYYGPDEDGYDPPKKLVMDGIAEDLAAKELKKTGLEREYEVSISNCDCISLETVYIVKDSKKQVFTLQELEDAKKSLMSVPVRKIYSVKKRKLCKKDEDDD